MEKPIDKNYKLFIDGKWVDSKGGGTFNAYNPANGEMLATCVNGSKEDVDYAVEVAWKAFETWKDVNPQQRAAYLLKIADKIEENAAKLAMVETLDNGKPIREPLSLIFPWV